MIKRVFGLVLLFTIITSSYGQTSVEKVQASFIASFMRYVKWPKQESMKTFTVGIYGEKPAILNELNKIVNGKLVGYATIQVVVVESIDEIKNCQVLYVPSGRSVKLKKIMSEINENSIMTVTEEQDYNPNFSIINFKIIDNKLTFHLNNDIAKQNNIIISNKLALMAKG